MANTKQQFERVNSQLDRGEPWSFERAPISLLIEYLCLAFLIFLGVDLTAKYPMLTQVIYLGIPIEISLPALLPIVFLGVIVHHLKNSLYTIRPEQVRATHGRMSLSKQDTEIDITDIRGVEIRRPLLGRIFNYGHVEVGTAAHQGEEIYMRGVSDPSCIRDIILHRKELAVQRKGLTSVKSVSPDND